ncbi:MAG: RNA 2',3'-cyclic phosphodiesterase [Candidatus Parvarchaeota archaeon]|nr:RNA 2',3'-cyclic phosphodiesterase [Candidatus Parvarchaeota archaeon]
MRRLFIAIELPDKIKEYLSDIIEDLKKEVDGRFISKDKLHITILFLGDSKLSDEEILKRISSVRFHKEIVLTGLGIFRRARGNVIFIGIEPDLYDVYTAICSRLGIKADKSFSPHITLCRTEKDLDKLSEDVKDYKFYAEKLSLFNSDMKTYTRIY